MKLEEETVALQAKSDEEKARLNQLIDQLKANEQLLIEEHLAERNRLEAALQEVKTRQAEAEKELHAEIDALTTEKRRLTEEAFQAAQKASHEFHEREYELQRQLEEQKAIVEMLQNQSGETQKSAELEVTFPSFRSNTLNLFHLPLLF